MRERNCFDFDGIEYRLDITFLSNGKNTYLYMFKRDNIVEADKHVSCHMQITQLLIMSVMFKNVLSKIRGVF